MSIDPPFGIIRNEIENGTVIPFLGAAASLSGRALDTVWNPEIETFLPTTSELALQMAKESGFPSEDEIDRHDLGKVASYYEEVGDRPSLVSYMRERFVKNYQPGLVHNYLADLDTPLLIVTTNYDDLIERAFQARNKNYHLVTHPIDRKDIAASVLWWQPGAAKPEVVPPKLLPLALTDTTIIYKMHGSIYRHESGLDSFVVTEEDHVDFITRLAGQVAIPPLLMMEFRKRRFLFLGFGLRDWNLRVLFKTLRRNLMTGEIAGPAGLALLANPDSVGALTPQDLRSWAVQQTPSDLEVILWRGRNVLLFDWAIDEFIQKLAEKS